MDSKILRLRRHLFLFLFIIGTLLASAPLRAAAGAFNVTVTPFGGGTVMNATSFSIKALDAIEIKRISSWFYANFTTSQTGTVEVWYKPGPVLTATLNSTGWTKAISSNMTFNWNLLEEIPEDIDVVIRKGEEMSFVVTGTGAAQTVGDSTPFGIFNHASCIFDTVGRGGIYNATTGATFNAATTGFQGTISFDYAFLAWTGAQSSNWNDPANWDRGIVPDAGESVEIVAGTPFKAMVPNNAQVESLTINTGAQLLTDANSRLDIANSFEIEPNGEYLGSIGATTLVGGDVIFAAAARYLANGASLVLDGNQAQNVTTSSLGLGLLSVTNTSDEISVRDDWSANNFGLVSTLAGAVVSFKGANNNFAGNSFANEGLFKFGLTQGGVAATLQRITPSAQSMGNVVIYTQDALDVVELAGNSSFNDLALTGLGPVNFLGSLMLTGIFDHQLSQALTLISIGGSGEILLKSNTLFTVTGNVTGRTLRHQSSAQVDLQGSLTLTELLVLESLLPTGTAFSVAGLSNVGELQANSNDMARFNALTAGRVAFAANGSVDVFGNLIVGDYVVNADGRLTQTAGALVTINQLQLAGNHRLSIANTATVGSADLSGTAQVGFNANVTVNGDMAVRGGATYSALQNTTFGGALAQNVVATGQLFSTGRLVVTNTYSTTLAGNYRISLGGTVNPAFSVATGSAAELAGLSVFDFVAVGQAALVRINGTLLSGNDASTAPLLRGGAAANQHASLAVNGRLNARGLRLENFGAAAFAYALSMGPASTIDAFSDISITNVAANTGVMLLGNTSVPTKFFRVRFEGTAPESVNASALSGIRIELSRDSSGGGNLYQPDLEVDPNNVLIWEDAPVLDILGGTVLPSALVENVYKYSFMATGGNKAWQWSIANAPAWLSMNAVTGELSAVPPRSATGTHEFVVLVSDSSTQSQIASKVVRLTVDGLSGVSLVILSQDLSIGRIGQRYGYGFAAAGGAGGPYSWAMRNTASLPAGLSLTSNGILQGIPAANSAGVYAIDIEATDQSGNSALRRYTLLIENDLLPNGSKAGAILSDGAGSCSINGQNSGLLLLMLMLGGVLTLVRRRAKA